MKIYFNITLSYTLHLLVFPNRMFYVFLKFVFYLTLVIPMCNWTYKCDSHLV